jgi:outer membrane protein assembly factor BamB
MLRDRGSGQRWGALVVAVLLSASFGGTGVSSADAGRCTGDGGSGGDWPMYGHDLAGSRNQVAEDRISPTTVAGLTLAWNTASPVTAGASTAVVSGRCVYIAGSSSQMITALDIVTGEIVWREASAPSYPLKKQTAALAVVDGRVYANVSDADGASNADASSVGVALDANTGDVIYESEPVQFGEPTTSFSSAVVYDGLQLVVTNGGDGIPDARPGYAILDAQTGEILHAQTTIPLAQLDQGYAGGGQWATPVVDVDTGYAFNGTANPYSKTREHRYDNALIKTDLSRGRASFGSIVDAYKGNVDQYVPGLDRQPLCDEFGETIGYHPCCNFSVTCVQLDIDFGGSPTMWRSRSGDLMVGALQKSGVFHAVYSDTMQSAWTSMLSTIPPATAGNATSAANDGERVFSVANPGVLHALDIDTGRTRWVAPVGDGADYHPVSVANGVVYTIGNHGMLLGYDAATGTPLFATSMPLDGTKFCSTLAGGVSIAHHTVLANCDGTLFAYRLPA